MPRSPNQIDELLDLGGIQKSSETRNRLREELERAGDWYAWKGQKQASSVLFKQLDASIRKTLTLIGRLQEYPDTRDFGFEMHPIGTGIADAATGREMIEGRSIRISRRPWIAENKIPNTAPEHLIIGINTENLLRALQASADKARRKGRGQPKREDKLSVVFYADAFFRTHSLVKPSTDEDSPFRHFAERFFKAATGLDAAEGSLDWQIRQVLTNKRVREKQRKKHD